MEEEKSLLHHCLYFTANTLSRIITRMADEEFKTTGLSPSHAFLMMIVTDNPGIAQKALGQQLHLAPSTVTRFIDSLVYRGYLIRKNKGKTSAIYSTNKGKQLKKPIDAAWKRLYHKYSTILGMKEGDQLTKMIDNAGRKLEGKV